MSADAAAAPTTGSATAFESAPPVASGPPTPATHYPPGAHHRQVPARAEVHSALTYSSLDGYRDLQLDVYAPADRTAPPACVVWIHGGAWLLGSRQFPPEYWPAGSAFQAAIDAGLAVAAIDYRHSREAPFPAQLHDAKAAVRYLRRSADELGIDPGRIGVWGESAGGHLAALVALVDDPELEGGDGVTGPSSAVSAAVLFYPVTDVDLVRVPGADHVFLGTDPLPQLARAVEFLRARLSA
jgi:acetyl esterase/lipase